MQKLEDEFKKRGIAVLAVSQEDQSLESFPKILDRLEFSPWFSILGDIGYAQTKRFARTTAYLIDEHGVVQQVFPMETYARASWWAVLREIDRVRDRPAVEEGHHSTTRPSTP